MCGRACSARSGAGMFSIKPTLALFAVTLAAAAILGAVYEITEGPIAEQKTHAEVEAVSHLLPAANETRALELRSEDSSVTGVTECFGGGGLVGYAVTAAPRGYGGEIRMMVALGLDGAVEGVLVLGHSETPGLGSQAAAPEFLLKYEGVKSPLTVVKRKAGEGEVEAIASVTISVSAITAGVNDALKYYGEFLRGGMN